MFSLRCLGGIVVNIVCGRNYLWKDFERNYLWEEFWEELFMGGIICGRNFGRNCGQLNIIGWSPMILRKFVNSGPVDIVPSFRVSFVTNFFFPGVFCQSSLLWLIFQLKSKLISIQAMNFQFKKFHIFCSFKIHKELFRGGC